MFFKESSRSGRKAARKGDDEKDGCTNQFNGSKGRCGTCSMTVYWERYILKIADTPV